MWRILEGGLQQITGSSREAVHVNASQGSATMTQHPRNPTVHEIRSEAARSKLEKLR